MIKIDSSIPVPDKFQVGGRARYPWADMKPKQSFFVPVSKSKSFTAHYSRMIATQNKEKYAIERRTEGGVKGVRVWRLK